MNTTSEPRLSVRWLYLTAGFFAMLLAGIVYGWSILKAPLAETFGWNASQLALNFTLTMCLFCIGVFAGGYLTRILGNRLTMILGAVLAFLGFFITSRLAGSLMQLYVGYGCLAGAGIGIAYNVVVSTVNAWFPDKKGLCSGVLMMGFGTSALIIGSVASRLIDTAGWRAAYMVLGICLGVVLTAAAFIIQPPAPGIQLPKPERKAAAGGESFEAVDYTTMEMVKRFSFWRAFFCIVFLAAVGNTVISFARDLALSVGAAASLATTLVGVLSVCNGLGRIVIGLLFDKTGRKVTMLFANLLAVCAAGVTLAAVSFGSLPLCILGLCATGFSYGAAPTITSALTSAFYGTKNFPQNFSVMNFNLLIASLIATVANNLLVSTGGYAAPFTLLLVLAVLSLLLGISIRKP